MDSDPIPKRRHGVSGQLQTVYLATKSGGWAAGMKEVLSPTSAERFAGRRNSFAALFPILGAFAVIDGLLLLASLKKALRERLPHTRHIIYGAVLFFGLIYIGTIVAAYVF